MQKSRGGVADSRITWLNKAVGVAQRPENVHIRIMVSKTLFLVQRMWAFMANTMAMYLEERWGKKAQKGYGCRTVAIKYVRLETSALINILIHIDILIHINILNILKSQ